MRTLCRKFTKIIHKIENALIASRLLVSSSKKQNKKKTSILTPTQIYIVMSTAGGWKIKVTVWIWFLCFAVRYILLWGAAAVGNWTVQWLWKCESCAVVFFFINPYECNTTQYIIRTPNKGVTFGRMVFKPSSRVSEKWRINASALCSCSNSMWWPITLPSWRTWCYFSLSSVSICVFTVKNAHLCFERSER